MNLLKKPTYWDCKINYECIDNIGIFYGHRFKLASCSYFETFFKWNKPQFELFEDNYYVNVYNMKFDFYENTLLFCIDQICGYFTTKIMNYEDALNAFLFLNLDKKINDLLDTILNNIFSNDNNYDNIKNTINYIYKSDINIDIKKAFLARTLYLLNNNDKIIYQDLKPELIFGNNYNDNNDIFIVFLILS